jgi:hypothetical protein
MSRKLNLKDKMEEINERFSHKNKAALANDLLENKLAYTVPHSATSTRRWPLSESNISRRPRVSKPKPRCSSSSWSR